ncbi:MAG TPA: hypothetical protein VEG60_13450 [Candidatus Binatia bacterium]|nr:hypothetical protein [Candidatus Binatia bacterium]
MTKTQNGTVPPKRQPYESLRSREYLTAAEVDRLIDTARRRGRYGHRDASMIGFFARMHEYVVHHILVGRGK